ncbi:MAG: hypothetical protein MR296_02055 [Tenericutes bacterium]|nr:hypothetical protein [Mycoplasmatota bacterium]
MTQDLNKMFEMAKKQEKIALALEEAEKTLDVKAFRKAIALFDELGVKNEGILHDYVCQISEIIMIYDRQRQSEIETLIGDAKEELDGSKLEEAKKLVSELLVEEDKEIYTNMINEYNEAFIEPKKLHDKITSLINKAKNTLDESLLDEARKLIEELDSKQEKAELKIEASKVQRLINDSKKNKTVNTETKTEETSKEDKVEEETVIPVEEEKEEKATVPVEEEEPVKEDTTKNEKLEEKIKKATEEEKENKKYEDAKRLVDVALNTKKTSDINAANEAISKLKSREQQEKLYKKLSDLMTPMDSLYDDEDKEETKKNDDKEETYDSLDKKLDELIEKLENDGIDFALAASVVDEYVKSAKKLNFDDYSKMKEKLRAIIDFVNAKNKFNLQENELEKSKKRIHINDVIAMIYTDLKGKLLSKKENEYSKSINDEENSTSYKERLQSKLEESDSLSSIKSLFYGTAVLALNSRIVKLDKKDKSKKVTKSLNRAFGKLATVKNKFRNSAYKELSEKIINENVYENNDRVKNLMGQLLSAKAISGDDKKINNLINDFLDRVEDSGLTELEKESLRYEVEQIDNFKKINKEDYVTYNPLNYTDLDEDYKKYGLPKILKI